MLVKVREDLVAKLSPGRYMNFQSSGESAFRRLSCRVFPTEAFDVSRCHSPLPLIPHRRLRACLQPKPLASFAPESTIIGFLR
jgi:hypothetical protein